MHQKLPICRVCDLSGIMISSALKDAKEHSLGWISILLPENELASLDQGRPRRRWPSELQRR